MGILADLTVKGLFPAELPPCFKIQGIPDDNAAQNLVNVCAAYISSNVFWPERHSIPRSRYSRRVLDIPHIAPTMILANDIANGWAEITAHYNKSQYSYTKPTHCTCTRAVKIPSFSEFEERKFIIGSGKRYVASTDFSRYYSSLYTHSIPWALHGKPVAKANRSGALLGNRLDKACRAQKDSQTIGIPIGPDTSLIISEILSCGVDIAIADRTKNVIGKRYIDDYFFYTDNLTEAEEILTRVAGIAAEFELEINSLKTKITEQCDSFTESWKHIFSSSGFFEIKAKQRQDIIAFANSVFSAHKLYKDDAIGKYTAKYLSTKIIDKENWDVFEALLITLATFFPNALRDICKILVTYNEYGYPIRRSVLSNFYSSKISHASTSGHHEELAWCLWASMHLDIDVNLDSLLLATENGNSICRLLALHLLKSMHIPWSESVARFNSYFSNNIFVNNQANWLLLYEIERNELLYSVNTFRNNDLFTYLNKNSISLFNPTSPPDLLFTPTNIFESSFDPDTLSTTEVSFDPSIDLSYT